MFKTAEPIAQLAPTVPQKLTVLQLINGEVFSGLERIVDHLTIHAAGAQIDMHLAMLKPETMRDRMSARGAQIHDIRMRSRFDFSVAAQAVKIVREQGCQLIHSHTVRSAIIARRVQRATGLPWLHHVHSPALYESERRGLNLVNFLAELVVMRHADRVVAVSPALLEYAVNHYGVERSRAVWVPNGVDSVAAKPNVLPAANKPNPDSAANAATVANAAPLQILTTGLYRRRKGIEHIAHCSATLRDAGYVFEWRVVGEFTDASYERELRALIEQFGLGAQVRLEGFTTNLAPYLDRADLFVCPSLYGEGMPMAVLEAMAFGVPVVGSDIDGIRDVLADGAGLLVPAGSAAELARGIQSLIRDPARRLELGAIARQKQRDLYSIDRMCSTVFDLYRELVSSRTAARLLKAA